MPQSILHGWQQLHHTTFTPASHPLVSSLSGCLQVGTPQDKLQGGVDSLRQAASGPGVGAGVGAADLAPDPLGVLPGGGDSELPSPGAAGRQGDFDAIKWRKCVLGSGTCVHST